MLHVIEQPADDLSFEAALRGEDSGGGGNVRVLKGPLHSFTHQVVTSTTSVIKYS